MRHVILSQIRKRNLLSLFSPQTITRPDKECSNQAINEEDPFGYMAPRDVLNLTANQAIEELVGYFNQSSQYVY